MSGEDDCSADAVDSNTRTPVGTQPVWDPTAETPPPSGEPLFSTQELEQLQPATPTSLQASPESRTPARRRRAAWDELPPPPTPEAPRRIPLGEEPEVELNSGNRHQNQFLRRLKEVEPEDMAGLEAILADFIRFVSPKPVTPTAITGSHDGIAPPTNLSTSDDRPTPPGPATDRPIPPRPATNRPTPSGSGYDPVEAAKLQKLWRANPKKVMDRILKGARVTCSLEESTIFTHLSDSFSNGPVADGSHLLEEGSSSEEEVRRMTRRIGAAELSRRLSRMSNTAPGPDRVQYYDLKKADPGCLILSAVYNWCLKAKRVPAGWKESVTILLYKNGDQMDISNWRPLSLGNCIAKLYAAVLPDRMTEWATGGNRLSPEQKGFLTDEGCLEENFLLQSAIDDSRRSNKQLCVAWLDLTNAFGSVSHTHIFKTLERQGLPLDILTVIRDLYSGATTKVRTRSGFTGPIALSTGVKQGCPLSPIVFNLAIEPMLRAIRAVRSTTSYKFKGKRQLQMMVYADDICVTASTPNALQLVLSRAGEAAEACGLRFKPSKCATLHIDCRQGRLVQSSIFNIQGGNPAVLKDGESYRHLGVPTGFRAAQTPSGTIEQMLDDLDSIDTSPLAMWQKIDAVSTFIMPRLDFIARGGFVFKTLLYPVDKSIKRLAKKWLHLPQRASPEVVFLNPSQGGAGLLPLVDSNNIATLTQAYRMLTCKDRFVSKIAWSCLNTVVRRKVGRSPTFTPTDVADYLNGKSTGIFDRDGGDIRSLWTRTRKATVEMCKHTTVRWTWNARGGMEIHVATPGQQPDVVKVHPVARQHLVGVLRKAVRASYLKRLLDKPDQGKVFDASSKWSVSNHFMRNGQFMRHADFKFINPARLDLLPLNGTMRFDSDPGQARDRRCRRCKHRLTDNHHIETLPHVLNHCKSHLAAIKHRHDAVQNRIVRALPNHLGTVVVDRTALADSRLRPDIVITNELERTVTIVDICVPFENTYEALALARLTKIQKYQPIADEYTARGYTVELDAIVVGSLGSWDPANERILQILRIPRKYLRLMRFLIVSDVIGWSRDIYIEHVTGASHFPRRLQAESFGALNRNTRQDGRVGAERSQPLEPPPPPISPPPPP